jgi:hypothetical protein
MLGDKTRFIDKCGRNRIGFILGCQSCNKEFISRIQATRPIPKYCSVICQKQGRQKKIKTICAWCHKDCYKTPSKAALSKSGLHFCSRKCKDEAQKLGGITKIMPSHFGTAKIIDYRSLFIKEELVCSRCGYKEFSCAVEIHHKDHNRENNHKNNLLPLCANCHSGLHNNMWQLPK